MMMSKPAPKEAAAKDEAPPSFAMKPAQAPQNQVEDLERRLAMLGGVGGGESAAAPPAAAPDLLGAKPAPPPAAAPAPAVAKAPTSGKSALLARIKAAQEKTKQAQAKTEAPVKPPPAAAAPDLLMDLDAPNAIATPPPSFDTSLLPPPASSAPPPPSFEAVQQPTPAAPMAFAPPPPPMEAVAPPPPFEALAPPPPMGAPSAPVYQPSAPSFDLLGDQQFQPPPPLDDVQAVPPPPLPAMEPQIDEDVLAALDPEERDALLAEQRQIMEQIEKDKVSSQASGAAARAMAFDQRSNAAVARAAGAMEGPSSARAPPSYSASSSKSSKKKKSKKGQRTIDLGAGEEVPLHGQERTKQAIKDGTAVTVQCMNCQNFMQVTGNATLMFCPVCQVVSPVMKQGDGGADAGGLAAVAGGDAQMDADAKLAQQLQNEEYKMAGSNTQSRPATQPKTKQKKPQQQQDGQTWYDWLVGAPKAPAAAGTAMASVPDRGSGELPSRRAGSGGGGLVSAQTGTETTSRSFDEGESLLASGGGGGGGGARMAQQKGMFACVTDSIATATTAMYTDPEGNVHGVDSSSLLAMPQVSRQRE